MFEELWTILTEVEAIVNSHPLTYVCDDTDGISYPLHLLRNDERFDIVSTHKSLTRRAKQWRHEHLTGLRENVRNKMDK